jgi:hypothetical protein
VVPLALMNGRWAFGVYVTLLACGSTRSNPQGAAEVGANSAEGGASATAGAPAGPDAGGAALDLSLDVVHRDSQSWVPAAQAHVRIDGSGTSLEVLSDDDGHVVARVGGDTGPWDVTVALAGFSPVSILGVTESLSAPVHLSGRGAPSDPEPKLEPTRFSGAIVGRSWPGSVLDLSGPGVRDAEWNEHDYSARVDLSSAPVHPRILATEWDSYDDDAAPLNAVWLGVPDTADASVDPVGCSRRRRSISAGRRERARR